MIHIWIIRINNSIINNIDSSYVNIYSAIINKSIINDSSINKLDVSINKIINSKINKNILLTNHKTGFWRDRHEQPVRQKFQS